MGARLSGPANPNWKGGRKRTKDGYILVLSREHPAANPKHPYLLEHCLVMEQIIGRSLLPTEVVHHLNGIRDDNRPENLELMKRGAHTGQHQKGLVHKPFSDEVRSRMSAAHKGKHPSDATRRRLSESHKRLAETPEWRAHLDHIRILPRKSRIH